MKQVVGLEIPLGYKIADKIKNVKIWEAEKILVSKKQRYYTKAIRKGTEADLFSSYIVCPHCNSEFVLNTRYSTCGYHWYLKSRISDETVLKWSSLQLSFFDKKNDKILYISSPVDNLSEFECPKCGNVSNCSDKIKQVSIIKSNKKISIKSEITSIKEIMNFKWFGENSVVVTFPMYEVLTFNYGRGKTYISIQNDKGEIQWQRDVTLHPELLEGTVAHNLIKNNKMVNRNLKRMFMSAWNSELPYSGKQITVENLVKMTMFVGYPEEFYRVVPYELDSMAVESSFKDIAKKMHYSSGMVDLYEESDLPKVKSVRRIFFNNPGLFFYIREAEMILRIICDLNIFCEFLKMNNVYEVLSDLHIRPGIIDYITDLCKLKSSRYFLKNVKYDWHYKLGEAIEYSCANQNVRKMIQDSWNGNGNINRIVQRKPVYSILMKRPEERIADCSIDGYDFFWLRNSNEYANAGKQLDNCLSTWSPNDCPVVCVKKQDKYVAAIEISAGKIVQAKASKNSKIEHDKKLQSAFLKWQEKYGISWLCDDDDDDDELFNIFDL